MDRKRKKGSGERNGAQGAFYGMKWNEVEIYASEAERCSTKSIGDLVF